MEKRTPLSRHHGVKLDKSNVHPAALATSCTLVLSFTVITSVTMTSEGFI
jgi:hypothetical protein